MKISLAYRRQLPRIPGSAHDHGWISTFARGGGVNGIKGPFVPQSGCAARRVPLRS